jgi:hypothetical protein
LNFKGYVVEKCPEGSDVWEKCPGNFIQPKATIKHLEEGKAYKFRVKAENIHGESEPLETRTRIVVKPPYSKFSLSLVPRYFFNQNVRFHNKLNIFL